MRFCTPTQGEHGFPYLLPTLMTLRNTFHPENPRSSIGAKVEISRFAVGDIVNIAHLFPSLPLHRGSRAEIRQDSLDQTGTLLKS